MAMDELTNGNDETSNTVGKACFIEEFKEFHEVQNIIHKIPSVCDDSISVEMATERFLYIMDQYQEQPHLLDPHLETLLRELLVVVKANEALPAARHLAFKLMYLVTKTRGYKVIVRMLPHEVADLEPVLEMLAQQDPTNVETWETRYMLLLWLSIVCMIPFDMVRLDSSIRGQNGKAKQPIMDRIINTGKRYLYQADKSGDAAAYMLSRFMTRPDVKSQKLPELIDWILVSMKNADRHTLSAIVIISGALATLALLFKQGKREDLVKYAPTVLEHCLTLNLTEINSTVLRKLSIKLLQRMGLTFLKAKVAAWRYQRGNRSLAENLALKQQNSVQSVGSLQEDDDDEYEIPDEIEEVIEQLLKGLRDKDTVVRWSAAKGVGRITGRLPKELADEVVGSIMELFTITETDAAWHGGCLALAELGRRGLLLPQRLPDVVPVIMKALNYDERRGTFSVGAHVRDAACYVCWAFARAYDPQEMFPHVRQIANGLLIVSLLDREVNVRRAAAAAFQENVGRQGQFPHGIDILTTCDYFAVGNRTSCYTELSVFVAQFPEYTRSLIDHLVNVKSSHWDSSIQELSAQGLHNLVPKSPEYMIETVLPSLIDMCTSIDPSLRPGAILAVGEITHGLYKLTLTEKKSLTDVIPQFLIQRLNEITFKLNESQLFKGLCGDVIRKAVCHLIKKFSICKMPFHEDPIIDLWRNFLNECLEHVEPDVRAAGVGAASAFNSEYYRTSDGKAKPESRAQILDKYLSQLRSKTETTRMGFTLALGVLPRFILQGHLDTVISCLHEAMTVTDANRKWAGSRRDAIHALSSVCQTVGVEKTGSPTDVLCSENVPNIYRILFEAMEDYTLESRGDIGAWVREASMSALYDITSLIVKKEPCLITADISEKLFRCLLRQSVEKIDRTRAHAGEIFAKLIYHEPQIPDVPHIDELYKIFPKDEITDLNWAASALTFPIVTKVLSVPVYTYEVLLGLTVSVGGLTESLVKHSSVSLMSYIYDIARDQTALQNFADLVLKVFADHLNVDRVTLPMFKMLDQLLARGFFSNFDESNKFPVALLELSKKEISKSREPQKLLASIDVFSDLLQFPGLVRDKTLSQLTIFLCHKYPIVRKTSANKLYESLVTYDDIVPEHHLDEIMTLLSETQWDEPVSAVRPVRNQLCDMLGIPKPVLKTAK